RDWSSDVCSSDLRPRLLLRQRHLLRRVTLRHRERTLCPLRTYSARLVANPRTRAEHNGETQRVHGNSRRGAGHIDHSSASPLQTRYSASLRSVRPRTVRPPALSHRMSWRHHTSGGSPALTCRTSVELHAAAGPTLYAHDVTAAHWCTSSGRWMHLATASAYRATLSRSIASHSSGV